MKNRGLARVTPSATPSNHPILRQKFVPRRSRALFPIQLAPAFSSTQIFQPILHLLCGESSRESYEAPQFLSDVQRLLSHQNNPEMFLSLNGKGTVKHKVPDVMRRQCELMLSAPLQLPEIFRSFQPLKHVFWTSMSPGFRTLQKHIGDDS